MKKIRLNTRPHVVCSTMTINSHSVLTSMSFNIVTFLTELFPEGRDVVQATRPTNGHVWSDVYTYQESAEHFFNKD